MRRKVKRTLAFLMALALMMSLLGTDRLLAAAESPVAAAEAERVLSAEVQREEPAQETAAVDELTLAGDEDAEESSDYAAPEDAPTESEQDQTNSTEVSGEETTAEEEGTEETIQDSVTDETETSETESEEQTETSAEETAEEETMEETDTETEEESAEPEMVEFVPDSQPEGMKVKAYAFGDVLPENAKMIVRELAEDDPKVTGALNSSNVEYDGFIAFDISFYDGDALLEPEDGSVSVSIEVEASRLPGEADADSLQVQHLAEKDGKIEVQTVADTADQSEGTVALKESDAVIAAEFAVDGFSAFAITWAALGAQDAGTMPLAASYTDTAGNPVLFEGDSASLTTTGYGSWNGGELKNGNAISITNNNNTVTAKTIASAQVVTLQKKWGNRVTATQTIILLPKTVEAKVYLRYSNEVPSNINGSDAAANYGPAGDNTPYITVTVNLEAIVKNNGIKPYIKGSYIYFSIDNDSSYQGSNNRKDSAASFWGNYIYPNIDSEGRSSLDAIFGGEGKFIGYVLKMESDDWHIDGVLAEDPPNYVVELYDLDKGGTAAFAISDNDEALPGVTLEAFRNALEAYLGGDSNSYEYEFVEGKLIVSYRKDGESCRTTIEPYTGDENTDAYSILYDAGKFTYHMVTNQIYYLCRLQMTTEVFHSVTVTKKVVGNMGDWDKSFSFTVTQNGETVEQFALKHEESKELTNLRSGMSVTISEEPGDYAVSVEVRDKDGNPVENYSLQGGSVSLIVESGMVITFTNAKNASVDTGVLLDSLPYVVILFLVIAGAGIVFLKKRRERDFD